MSKLLQVKQNKTTKEKFNHPIVDILLERTTKQKVAEVLHTSERKARDVIAECSMHYPVIAHSGSTGYRRAKDIDSLTEEELELEIQEVLRTLGEHRSRVKCLKKKMKPLIAWLKVAEKKRGQTDVRSN